MKVAEIKALRPKLRIVSGKSKSFIGFKADDGYASCGSTGMNAVFETALLDDFTIVTGTGLCKETLSEPMLMLFDDKVRSAERILTRLNGITILMAIRNDL